MSNSLSATSVQDLSTDCTDGDAGQTITMTILTGDGDSQFQISAGNVLQTSSTAIDLEKPSASYTLTIQMVDDGSPALTGTAIVYVTVSIQVHLS